MLAGERHLRAKSGPVGSAISDVKKYRARQAVVPAAKHAVRNARCGRRGAEGGVRAARSACWCSPLRRLAGRLISTRWGGEGGLLALAATKAGRPAYFQPMGRRGRLAGARRYEGWPAGLFPTDGAARAGSSPKPSWKAGLAPLRRSGGTSGCAKNSLRTSPPIRRCGL